MGDLQQASPIPTNIPKGPVTEWAVDDVRNWLSQSMQLPQYLEQFEENEIAGDVLVHLDHDALKDLEVASVGHRLYLLKQIYNLKIAHGVKFEKDDYVPISAPKGEEEDEIPPANILKHLRDRDSKIQILEYEVKRMNDQIYRLKEELVPVFKYTREKPLPTPDLPTPNTATTSSSGGSSLARKFSTKKLFLGSGNRKPTEPDRNNMEISKPLMSPTYLNNISDERRPESPRSPTKNSMPITPGLQPPTPYTPYALSDTSNYSGVGYTSGSTSSGYPSSNVTTPYPSSGAYSSASTASSAYTSNIGAGYVSPITPRRERSEDQQDASTTATTERTPQRKRSNSATEKETDKVETQAQSSRSETNTRRRERKDVSKKEVSNPMKSFRVNLDDPCWKVLPAAMKKYDVKGREEDYRLYITYENTERKLSSNEKPLIIFQQLQKEGRNPLFMLRYAGKGREGDHERERERRERDRQKEAQKDEDPTTPKGVPEGYARYNDAKAGNGML